MTLHYVYGIVPASRAGDITAAAITGLEGSSVRAVVEGPFAAVASEVDASMYGADHLNERVRDLDWLTPRAAVHQDVNGRALELCEVVLPLAFGALYRDEDRVREMLRDDATTRRARLEALAGRAEWVITVMRDRDSDLPAERELRELDHEIATSTPGRAFLLEKRRASVATAAHEKADASAALRALAVLEPVAERTYREPVAKGGGDVVVLRLSLLAARDRTQDVDGAIADLRDELSERGYRVRATGPWPAYRFGTLP